MNNGTTSGRGLETSVSVDLLELDASCTAGRSGLVLRRYQYRPRAG
ncbi:hypothetical protein [Haloactinopolyspora alba]|nr:hypothetical protein [Haloactinopolyspora alba]